ncbi:unnamed protein product [Darwinula stevensoni]|uniref:TROVE domain-containing protein n=1 Tax=Darwinula stevensoni TaxID=69355 RepID=A0A7R8XAQ6_9CRUS|nr:unnamed protein product [Darwinula stevensoni]CAG0890264.1 unnamed protein product [Darwinula stevensoni]
MTEANNLAVQSLRRFLHIGGDSLNYNPWFFCNEPSIQQINQEKLADAIEQCATSGGEKALTEEFKKIFENGSSPHPICVIVALAKSMKASDIKVRQEAYKLVHQVCRTSKELFMLMHCSETLNQPCTGWGRGFRRAICEWYTSHEPLALACEVTKHPGGNWTHKDILKLIHMKPKTTEQKLLFCYVMRGLPEAEKQLTEGEPEELKDLLSYLHDVDAVKHCVSTVGEEGHSKSAEGEEVRSLLEKSNLSLDHVPTRFHKSPEIWEVLIPRMLILEALNCVKRLSLAGLLKKSHPLLVSKLQQKLSDPDGLKDSPVHPAKVFLVLKEYENPSLVQKLLHDRAQRRHAPSGMIRRPPKAPPKPNKKVVEALNNLLKNSFQALPRTGKKWLVVLETTPEMVSTKCHVRPIVTVIEAAAVIALSLLKAEATGDVKILIREDKAGGSANVTAFDAEPTSTMKAFLAKLTDRCKGGLVGFTQSIQWSIHNNFPADAIIFITRRSNEFVRVSEVEPLRSCLSQFKSHFKSELKVVTCGFSISKTSVAAESPGVLTLSGFNETIPPIIHAFVSGAFS